MNRRRLLTTILLFVGLIGSVFAYDMVRRRSPVLGLDLQGGLSVIYAPKTSATQQDLELVRNQMRDQLEAFGITEPDVRVEGSNIVADLPGVNDQEAAKEALNVSGIVTLRPVLGCQTIAPQQSVTGSSTPASGGTSATVTGTPGTNPSAPTPTTSAPAAGSQTTTGPAGFRRPPSAASPPAETSIDTVPTPTTAPSAPSATTPPVTLAPGAIVGGPPTQPSGSNTNSQGQQVLPSPNTGEQCLVGPSGGSGEVFEKQGASAQISSLSGGWVVVAALRKEGEALWNNLARQCYNGQQTCPSRRLAIVLDDEIQSAPTVNTPTFTNNVEITGRFSEQEARDLAGVINRGAYPVEVVVERTETVSPTAGKDSLNAAILAGLIGVAIMLLLMVLYYRKLALVMILGLTIWGITVYVLATWVSQSTNYALTLAGATGIIIAVGVTVDTYVVFFERIRDERRAGRTFANAAPRSYRVTGRTVVSADVVSLIASLILFSLSVGSVKGFALYLGLTTVCDLLVFYFFTRPAVLLLSQTRWGRSSGTTKAVAGANS